ncbi:hypothetical protein KUTeg_023134 [Tegillarca granosa]|uniref:Uncharacterized protein n=1 Tax=Tegillarca granosa TaxID=220873 RepID=A0ABQ9E0R9_TEGGR|nr:hypothetical protein KUTeg_023134 [Tegillarca granosa]
MLTCYKNDEGFCDKSRKTYNERLIRNGIEGFYAEYLVQFGELSRNVKSYFKDNLEDVIRRQFHIDPEQPLMVQYFDREWNMWTNCNWDNITPGGGQGMDMYQTQPDDNSMFLMPDSEFTTVSIGLISLMFVNLSHPDQDKV